MQQKDEEDVARVLAVRQQEREPEQKQIVKPLELALIGDVFLIGRAPDCQIVVSQKFVSRVHAQIECNGRRFLLTDAGSANGTFVNGRRISGSHVLKHNDYIGLGSAEPLLRFDDPDPTFRTQLLHYDERMKRFFLNDKLIELTPSQFVLLLHLYRHIGEPCTYYSCAEVVWNSGYRNSQDAGALEQLISGIRKALRKIDGMGDGNIDFGTLIQVRRGIGYELVSAPPMIDS